LDFAPDHNELAIAADAADRAGEVGSGGVGRRRKPSLDQRAALAARALIRHRHTDYEDRLEAEVWDDEYLYREVKGAAPARRTSSRERAPEGRLRCGTGCPSSLTTGLSRYSRAGPSY
jgi:hypothetical protein